MDFFCWQNINDRLSTTQNKFSHKEIIQMKIIIKEPLKNAVIKDVKLKYAIEASETYVKSLDVTNIDISSDGKFGLLANNDGIIEIYNTLELKKLEKNENLSVMLHVQNGPNDFKLLALTGTVIFIRVDDKDRLQDVTDFDIHLAKKIVDFE